MVGVPKSTGCFICRKRKIKCDETWPNCLNCQKNGKSCPGPPQRHTFKDLGPRLASSVIPAAAREQPTVVLDRQCRSLTQLNERYTENGSVVHKFRISHNGTTLQKRAPRRTSGLNLTPPRSPFLRQPSPSQHHELARAWIAATTTGSPGVRMSVFGPFIQDVPARLGHNSALDAAVAVLVNTHTALVQKKRALEVVSPQLYLRAIKTLQTCLDDPQQGMSSNTICASVILSLVEALAGPRVGNRYLAHVGGAGRLMELQGSARFQESFTKEILRFSRGGIIITAIYERKPCFLTSADWGRIAFDKTGLDFEEGLNADLMRYMAEYPGILKELKELSNQPTSESIYHMRDFNIDPNLDGNFSLDDTLSDKCPSLDFSPHSYDSLDYLNDVQPVDISYGITGLSHCPARVALLHRVQNLKGALNDLESHLNAKLTNGSTAIEIPSIEENSPMPTSYHFTSWRDMTSFSCFWSLIIMTNKVMMRLLPPFDPAIYELQSECRSMAHEICKTWEDAWASKPIGGLHVGLSFVVAYEYCEPHVQEWMISSLNSLLDFQGVDAFRWSEETIAQLAGKLAGEGPDVSFSHVDLQKEAA